MNVALNLTNDGGQIIKVSKGKENKIIDKNGNFKCDVGDDDDMMISTMVKLKQI